MPVDRRPRHAMPAVIGGALLKHGLMEAYEQRPAYQRSDYIGWIMRAKLTETRKHWHEQMLAELRRGRTYIKMKWTRRTLR